MSTCGQKRLMQWGVMVMLLSGALGCGPPGERAEVVTGDVVVPGLVEVASSPERWTGVAVSSAGRIFVNFPRWSPDISISVGELEAGGSVRPYPDAMVNSWDETKPPEQHLVCVQSVYVDDTDVLWILDPANPFFAGVVEGGPKLVQVDLARNEVVRTILFGSDVLSPHSYLNDVRVDTGRGFAFITDSGAGALVVVDLSDGSSRRVLADNPSTRAEDVILTIGGRPWLTANGAAPQVHADGIALSPDREWLYFQALTGRTLYRITTVALCDRGLAADALAARVETVAESGAADGLAFAPDGRLYISAIEADAIKVLTPAGVLETVVADPRISWPDSFAVAGDGAVFFTTTQIHLGGEPSEPFRIFKIEAATGSGGGGSGDVATFSGWRIQKRDQPISR